jgi:hypothetical protein
LDDYICKPMRYAELADTLRRWTPAGEIAHSAQRSVAARR